jgi:uncharacterized protein YndB with AHSA1/START domain
MITDKKTPVATVRLRKMVSAPIDRVYKAWTEPEQMHKWFGCQQMTGLNIEQDFRVGGNYRIEMICGDAVMLVTGVFNEIEPNKKVVYTWTSNFPDCEARDSIVSVQFLAKGNNTEVVLDHTNFDSDKTAEGHTEGWSFALESLHKLFASE